ncbi:MAG TPA: nuclear transport factor 2 family protein [Rhizomicrobium sp.]
MDAAANKQSVRHILGAYAQSDIEPLLQAIHPDVVWVTQAPPEFYPFGGRHAARAGVLAGMAKIATLYSLNGYELIESVAEGDVVWTTANLDFTHRRSAMRVRFQLVSRWEFRDGNVVKLTEYFDSASVLLQEGRLAATG